jgi:hypothetical protein
VENADAWPVRAVRDQFGNPVGGVRSPAVDVPVATYVERGLRTSGSSKGAGSPYLGYDVPFPPDQLRALYPTHQDYVDKVIASARQLTEARWLTDYDSAELIERARAAKVP